MNGRRTLHTMLYWEPNHLGIPLNPLPGLDLQTECWKIFKPHHLMASNFKPLRILRKIHDAPIVPQQSWPVDGFTPLTTPTWNAWGTYSIL